MPPETATLFLKTALAASWQGSLVMLLILALRPLLGVRVSARWRCLLWVFFLIRLLAPAFLLPERPASVQNFPLAVERPAERALMAFDAAYTHTGYFAEHRSETQKAAAVETAAKMLSRVSRFVDRWPEASRWRLGAAIWAVGAGLLAAWLLGQTLRLRWRMYQEKGVVDAPIAVIWFACCEHFSLLHRPRLLLVERIDSPALVGFIRPSLLFPRKWSETFSPEDWEHVFMHELAHYRRGDHWKRIFQQAALCVHWFNPLVWVGFYFLRADRELAADELALKHLADVRAIAYGNTVIKFLSKGSGKEPANFMNASLQMKQRLRRIVAVTRRPKMTGSIVGFALVLIVAVVVLGRGPVVEDVPHIAGTQTTGDLVSAAAKNDLATVRKLLDAGVNVNMVTDGRTALAAAAEADGMEIVRLLVERKANVNLKTDGGDAPVNIALKEGWLDCADYLAAHGATCDPDFLAAAKGDAASLNPLLTSGAAPFAKLELLSDIAAANGRAATYIALYDAIRLLPGYSGWHPSDGAPVTAIARGHREVVEAMIQRGSGLNKAGWVRLAGPASQVPGMREWLQSEGFKVGAYTAGEQLIDAVEHEDLVEIRRLVRSGVDVNYRAIAAQDDWTPLTRAAEGGYAKAVKVLLEIGSSANITRCKGTDFSPLCLAKTPEIADMLLAAGADINATLYGGDVHIINHCVMYGPQEMVRWFIDHGVDPAKAKASEATLLFEARNPEIARLLIQHGVNVNAKDGRGATALHKLCNWVEKPAPLARVLLENGADPNARDNDGATPLMGARDGATVDVLVQFGADLKATTKSGAGVMQQISRKADASRLEALIRHGVPFDAKTDGQFLLLMATRFDQIDVMKFLLDRGVDPNARVIVNREQNLIVTPLVESIGAGAHAHYAAAKLLIEYGAKPSKAERGQWSEMDIALANRRPEIARLFWEHGFRGISELAYAISQGSPADETQKFLDKRVPADPPEDKHVSPLALAAQLGSLDSAKLLLHAKANVNGIDAECSPVYAAAVEGQDEMVEYLLKEGAHAGFAGLMQAALNSNPGRDQREKVHFEKTVQLLINAGCLNGITEDQAAKVLRAAIFTANPGGNPAVLKMLLAAGLDPKSRTKEGHSVMQTVTDASRAPNGRPMKQFIALLEASEKNWTPK